MAEICFKNGSYLVHRIDNINLSTVTCTTKTPVKIWRLL